MYHNLMNWFNPYPSTGFIVLKMLSAIYICCLYSSALRLDIFIEAKTMDPDQNAPREQSDLGPYCL